MSIAAFALAETTIAQLASTPVGPRKPPPKRLATAKRDVTAVAEPR